MNKGTLRWRPNDDGTGRWYLDLGPEGWVTNPKTGKTEKWIEIRGFNRKDDRPRVEKWRDDYAAERERLGAVKAIEARRNETVSDWFGRYFKAAERGEAGRKNRGQPQARVPQRRGIYKNHLEPFIGTLTMATVTVDHLRKIVRYLDEQARIRDAYYRNGARREDRRPNGKAPGLSRKSTAGIWSEVTTAFREACRSKRDDLRVLKVDITRDVLGPDGGAPREQAALFPAEVVALLSCPKVRLSRRRTYAAAIYTGLRLRNLSTSLRHGADEFTERLGPSRPPARAC